MYIGGKSTHFLDIHCFFLLNVFVLLAEPSMKDLASLVFQAIM